MLKETFLIIAIDGGDLENSCVSPASCNWRCWRQADRQRVETVCCSSAAAAASASSR
jgi:hypothetical protein